MCSRERVLGICFLAFMRFSLRPGVRVVCLLFFVFFYNSICSVGAHVNVIIQASTMCQANSRCSINVTLLSLGAYVCRSNL